MGVDSKRGKPCLTRFAVRERLEEYTLVDVMPVTGRRHQIRVHFYFIGHPVVGDLMYGQREVQQTYPRLMLHAADISLTLPSGKSVMVEAPVPNRFANLIERLINS
jgi:23S rRNA-/tRNA-specific pseudouridylate synthase